MSTYAHSPEFDLPEFIRHVMKAGPMRMAGHWQGRRRRGVFGPSWIVGGPGMPGPWGAGPKVGRGDVRLAILFLLREEPMHGYQMMQELSERTDGMWRPSSGSVYPTLQQLEDEGMIEAEESSGKRVFSLTEEGHAYLDDLSDPAPWEQFGSGGHDQFVGLRDAAFQLGAALIQVATSGNESQVAAAKDIVAEAKGKIYELLKEDG